MPGLSEFQKRLAADRAKMLEEKIEKGSGATLAPAPAPAPATNGMSQASFAGGRRPENNAQLAALLRKRMAEDAAERKARGE